MGQKKTDLYLYFKAQPRLGMRLKRFAKQRGIELTIALVGIFVGIATVLVSHDIGIHQEILQASRITDSYFNGIVELFAKSPDENQKINLLMIARTEAIIIDLHKLEKPEKLASVINFISNLKPKLFHRESDGEFVREKFIDLSEINLVGTALHNIDLSSAYLSYSNLSEADLSHTNLSNATLLKTNLSHATLDYANFQNADLRGANLHKARVYKTQFDNANLENAIWVNGIRCRHGSIGQCIY